MTDMKGKRAIVTGGGTGLGAAVSRSLAKRGVNLCINYSKSAEAAEATAAECRAFGVDAFAQQADVGEDADCRKLVDAAATRFGGLDILINNAGTTKFVKHGDLDGLSADDFQWIYRTNVISVFQMTRAARPHLEEKGEGAIVNVSSIAGVLGNGSSVAYAASKGALNTMTLSLARALAPKIRMNTVCPGYIGSGWFTKHQGAAEEQRISQMVADTTPLKLASQPEDIAPSIVFFAGPESRHVTGEFMIIDAGTHLSMSPLRVR